MSVSVVDACRRSIESQSERVAGILRARPDVSRPANARWSVRDTAAHLVTTTGLYAEIAAGARSDIGEFTPSVTSDYNFGRIADIAESDPPVLATLLTAAVERFLDVTEGRADDDPVSCHGGIRTGLSTISDILTGEYLLHGYDIAAGPADCEIVSDPVTWLMLCLGRVSQAQAVALGVLRFQGRQPDLAAGFLGRLHAF